MDRDRQLRPTEKVSTYDAKEAEGSPSITSTDETSVMNRASQRDASNGEVQTTQRPMHSNFSVNSKPKMLLMIKWRLSISEGLFALFPVAVTHGLKLGRSLSRQTNSEESIPTHQRPSSTNSFHHPYEVEPTQTWPFKRKDRYARRESHVVPYDTRRVVSCRILQSPGKSPNTSPPRKHARYRTNTNGALTKSNGPR